MEIPKRKDVIEKFKSNGGKIAAVYPYHYHRALFRAFDILPVEVWGPPGVDVSYSSSYLQPYVCSIAHSGLSFFNLGGLDVVDFLVVPHTCDSLQGLGSVFIDFVKPKQPVFTIYIPRGKSEFAKEFLAKEFRKIYNELVKHTGKDPSFDELVLRIEQEEEAFSYTKRLYEEKDNLNLSNSEFYRLIRSREYLPAEDFVKLAEEALKSKGNKQKGINIIVSGLVVEPKSVIDEIENLSGNIVWDDLACCGRRLYRPSNNADPFLRMAESVLSGPPEPSKGSNINERFEFLSNIYKKTKAKGIVFYLVKFCEMELFYLPLLRKKLKDANIPTVQIEVDINESVSDQALMRLEAFLEMIS